MAYREAGDAASKPIKILFVDDSATMRKVAEITFATESYDLSLGQVGAEVVGLAKKTRPDVVLVDADMPEVDGYEACKRLRHDAETGVIPVLLLSGPSHPFDERKAREAGVTDHIDKPFETQSLYDKVRTLATTPVAPAPHAAAAPPSEPAGKDVRAKIGNKTVLGLGAMGGQGPKPAAVAQKPAPAPLGQKKPAAPVARAKAAGGPIPARTGPIASPVATKPKPAPAAPAAQARPAAGGLAARSPAPPAPHAAPAQVERQASTQDTIVEIAQFDTDKSLEQKASSLSPEQVEAIRAVAREVIERVVWEVVPDLAEAIIKEELARLLKD